LSLACSVVRVERIEVGRRRAGLDRRAHQTVEDERAVVHLGVTAGAVAVRGLVIGAQEEPTARRHELEARPRLVVAEQDVGLAQDQDVVVG
jgi:hypothetical protein